MHDLKIGRKWDLLLLNWTFLCCGHFVSTLLPAVMTSPFLSHSRLNNLPLSLNAVM